MYHKIVKITSVDFLGVIKINLQATGNDTCVISCCVRYDIIFIRDHTWSRIKTSNPRENPADFLGVIKIKAQEMGVVFFELLMARVLIPVLFQKNSLFPMFYIQV